MPGITHATFKAHGEKGLAVEWNEEHVVDGNTGEILFREADGTIGTDSTFFWDNVNQRLGIGDYGQISSYTNIYPEDALLLSSTESIDLMGSNFGYVNFFNNVDPGAPISFDLSNGEIYTIGLLYIDNVGNNYFKGNVGIGSTAPQGKLHVGDQATNYFKVKADGEIELVGTARVVNHVVIHAETFKLIGAKPAVENSEGVFITLDFVHTAEKEAYASNFIPFRWDSDTDIEVGIDWMTDADGTGGDVVWGIEYLARKDNEQIAAATTTITEAFTGAGAGLMQRNHFTVKLLKGNLEADDIIGIRIFRDHDAAGDTLDLTARFLAFHLHFIRNKIGQAT